MGGLILAPTTTKEQVRAWTQQRWSAPKPLPSREEIKRQLSHNDFLINASAKCAR